MHYHTLQKLVFRKGHQLKKKIMKQKTFFVSLLFLFLAGSIGIGMFALQREEINVSEVTSSEINIADVSPQGDSSGLVVPASCGTAYAGTAGHEADYAACSACNVCGCNNGSSLCGGVCSVSAPAIPSNYGQTCQSYSPTNACGDYFVDSRGTYTCSGSCPQTNLSAPILPYTDLSCTTSRGYDILANACTGACSCSSGRSYDVSVNRCVNSPSALSFTMNGSPISPFYISYADSFSANLAWSVTPDGATFCTASGANFGGSGLPTAFTALGPAGLNTARPQTFPLGVSFVPVRPDPQVESSRPVLPSALHNIGTSGSNPVELRTGTYSVTCTNVAGSATKSIDTIVVCPTPVTYEPWSACSVSCGGGTRTRHDTNCFGTVVTEDCNTNPCSASNWREVAP